LETLSDSSTNGSPEIQAGGNTGSSYPSVNRPVEPTGLIDQDQLPTSEETPVQEKHTSGGLFSPITRTFQRGVGAVREWRSLQRTIQTTYITVSKSEWSVQESLSDYRLVLTSVSFKPQKLDQEIWSTYEELRTRTPLLKEKTRRRPLYLHRRRTLREYNAAWDGLFNQQKSLLETLAKAPKSVEFYNRIHLARIKKHEHELQEAEVAKRNAQAKESIEKVLSSLAQADSQGEIATVSSGILRLDDAQSFWRSRLQEIGNMETGRNMDPDEVIQIYRNLEGTIRDAPRMAEQVKEVEVQFIRMMTMHEELGTYGKVIIPAEDLARILIMVQDEIPKLWATGEWDKLRRSLNEISSFVKFYDLPVRSELSLAERRKPGLARALLAGASNLPLSQITPVVRGLVSAIDARDKFMSGHSDAVARVVVQIAKKMNWTGEDLEYIEIAALLHDVGKILIPENVLTKLDPLSPDDWKAIQTHPFFGAQIVKPIAPLAKIAPWIYSHQERWDGAGYPDKISDREIPAAARIIAVGEAFTVMTTAQPKRKALSYDEAITEITRGAGSQFDPEVAGALLQAIENNDRKSTQSNRG
jgi:HD-GYP domain-containing protein (c-di-GMP phosphodiesterase class II)